MLPILQNDSSGTIAAAGLVRMALHGLHGPVNVNGQTWNLAMSALGHSSILNDERLAGVLTYVRRGWGNYGDAVDPKLVASIRKQSGGRTALWTVEELLNPDAAFLVPTQSTDPLKPYRPLLASGNMERGRVLFHANLTVRCNACNEAGRFGGSGSANGRQSRRMSLGTVAKRASSESTETVVSPPNSIGPSGTIVVGSDATKYPDGP